MGIDVYDFINRTYDPLTGRFWQVDPLAEREREVSQYVYCGNNPIRFIDPDGMTKEERDKALKAAREEIGTAYNSAIPDNDRVKDGQLDCAGLVRYSIMQNSTIKDPFSSTGSGVTQIMGSSRPITVQDLKEGDLVVMACGGNENGHVGFVTNIIRDENGKVISYTLLHSEAKWSYGEFSGGGDVNEDIIEVGVEKNYGKAKYHHRYYQWDTPDSDKKEEKKKDEKSNNPLSWGQALTLIASWLLANPTIITNF